MRARIVVVVVVVAAVGFLLVFVLVSGTMSEVAALRGQVDTLQAEACVELRILHGARDVLVVELKALHGILPSEPLSRISDAAGSPYEAALLEALAIIYPANDAYRNVDRFYNRC